MADNRGMEGRAGVAAGLTILPLLAGAFLAAQVWSRPPVNDHHLLPKSEYHFVRLEYIDRSSARRGWGGRGWWRQDWPEAEIHFAQGVRRLTRIDTGEGIHLPLTDDRIFDYPWLYATQVGYWDLSDQEVNRLRDYLLRGGFLVVDDFYGLEDWSVFRDTMQRVLPDRPILDVEESHSLTNVLYTIRDRTFIPGLRHLRAGAGGSIVIQPQAMPPSWRAIYDDKGYVLVAINYNMDVGDAWEHADLPEYPEQMTTLAYRFGINYLVYSMTH
jgi:hypothetical protein